MNKKLRIVNSYRLTKIEKYIAERKEEYLNCKNKCNISSFHYEKLIQDIDKILRSFPNKEFISLYDDENRNMIFYLISEKLNSKERLLLYELIENKNDEIRGLQKCNTDYYNLNCLLSSKLALINKYISNSNHELSVDSYYKFKDLSEFDDIKKIIFDNEIKEVN